MVSLAASRTQLYGRLQRRHKIADHSSGEPVDSSGTASGGGINVAVRVQSYGRQKRFSDRFVVESLDTRSSFRAEDYPKGTVDSPLGNPK